MSTFLDDLFAAKIPQVPYSWTVTDVDSNGSPIVLFATGVLSFTDRPTSSEYFIGPARYVDSSVGLWGAKGAHVTPASIVPPNAPTKWVNQLMIMPSGSTYNLVYGNRTNFSVEVASLTPEVYTGSGFPGLPGAKTGVLVSRFWLGVQCLVLVVPSTFKR